MVDLNLLPWRDRLYHSKLKRVTGWFLAGILVLTGIGWGLMQHWQQQLHTQVQRNQQLQQEVQHLRHIRPLQRVLPSPKLEIQAGERVQKTKMNRSLHIKVVTVHYAKALDLAAMIKDKTNGLLSRRGTVTVDPRTNVLWLEDHEEQLKKLLAFIKRLDIPAQQIVIEARLVNMNQESARDLGIRLGLIAPSKLGTESNTLPSNGGRLGLDLAAKPLEATAASIGLTEALWTTQRLLDVELSALESRGKAKVIASPRLVTSNQIAAVIESGEDIPYQEFSANGTTSVAFKKAVLRLQVIPQITAKHELMISLVINQDADSGKRVQGVPIISTKSIETHILMRHGQTIVLGGIYQQDHNRQNDQIPFLGDLPIIGEVFQRKQMRTRHEALLIFITPRIVGS
ncbi:MAG: hypothetical protein CK424_08285 [Legionella sp.]|nr:MAG: hypothetical protein CK424_08285 [Legionella sp.]